MLHLNLIPKNGASKILKVQRKKVEEEDIGGMSDASGKVSLMA